MSLILSITKLLYWRESINFGFKLAYIQVTIKCAALRGGTLQQSSCQIYFPCDRGNCFPAACSQINTCCSICPALCAPSTLQMWLGTQTWQVTAPQVSFSVSWNWFDSLSHHFPVMNRLLALRSLRAWTVHPINLHPFPIWPKCVTGDDQRYVYCKDTPDPPSWAWDAVQSHDKTQVLPKEHMIPVLPHI